MKIIVGRNLTVKKPSEEIKEYCQTKLTIQNPEYYERLKLGKWLGGVSPVIRLYEQDGSDLILPFGCLQDIAAMGGNVAYLFPQFHQIRKVIYHSEIKPYTYQEAAIGAALKQKNGIVIMPCGAGKTQTALEIVSRIGGTCLWVTHTHNLMEQSMERAKSCFGLPDSAYGTITDGKINIGSVMTFATVQTMSKIDLPNYADRWDIVIVDECHRCIGSPTNVMMFYKVVSNINARYKIGLTATPHRADGLDQCMYSLLGPKIHEVTQEDVSETTCPVFVEWNQTHYCPERKAILSPDGTIVYSKLIEALTKDKERNKIIADRIRKTDGPTLVMSDRIAHLNALWSLIHNDKKAAIITGKSCSLKAKIDREDVLRRLNSGELDIVFATYKLAKEGLDVPNLRYVVFASPQKDETTVTQSAGRVRRKASGKKRGVIIDFTDDFGLMESYEKKRKRCYKKLNFKELEGG